MLEIELKMDADSEDKEAISAELDPELDKFDEFLRESMGEAPMLPLERAMVKTFLFHKARKHF